MNAFAVTTVTGITSAFAARVAKLRNDARNKAVSVARWLSPTKAERAREAIYRLGYEGRYNQFTRTYTVTLTQADYEALYYVNSILGSLIEANQALAVNDPQ